MKTTPIPVKFDRQGHSCNFYGGLGPTSTVCTSIEQSHDVRFWIKPRSIVIAKHECIELVKASKLTWLVLGGDPAARSHRVEQFTAL